MNGAATGRMPPAEAAHALRGWLDGQGRLLRWPTKRRLQRAVVFYLVAKFEGERLYSEADVNAVLDDWAAFRDSALLRRTLVEERLLARTADGREYRVVGTALEASAPREDEVERDQDDAAEQVPHA